MQTYVVYRTTGGSSVEATNAGILLNQYAVTQFFPLLTRAVHATTLNVG